MNYHDSEYKCPECDGTSVLVCPCCHETEEDCDVCEGTGLDPDLVDVAAYSEACSQLYQPGVHWTASWIENGKLLGRQSNDGQRVAIADYVLGAVERTP